MKCLQSSPHNGLPCKRRHRFPSRRATWIHDRQCRANCSISSPGEKPEAAQSKRYVPAVTDNVNEVCLGQNLFDVSHVETIRWVLVTPAGFVEPSRVT